MNKGPAQHGNDVFEGLFRAEAHFNEFEQTLAKFDLGWAKAALYFRTETAEHFGHSPGQRIVRPLVAIHAELEVRRKRLLAGDAIEALHAIQVCAQENLPLPSWLALAFIEKFSSTGMVGGPTSLDDAFCSRKVPKKTPKKVAGAQVDWGLGVTLWRAVWLVAENHAGLSAALDDVLANGNYGVKKTKATQLVNMVDKNQSELTGQKSLSQFWANRRKL